MLFIISFILALGLFITEGWNLINKDGIFYIFLTALCVMLASYVAPYIIFNSNAKTLKFLKKPHIENSIDFKKMNEVLTQIKEKYIDVFNDNTQKIPPKYFENALSIFIFSNNEHDQMLFNRAYNRLPHFRKPSDYFQVEIPAPIIKVEIHNGDMLETKKSNPDDKLKIKLHDEELEGANELSGPIQSVGDDLNYKKCAGDTVELNNTNPRDQWLVAGTYEDYKKKCDNAIGELPPKDRRFKQFVLDGGRHELRSGGGRGTIRSASLAIEKELERVFGNKLAPSNTPAADSAIPILISGNNPKNTMREKFEKFNDV